MKKEYDIEKVIELRDSQNLKWKEIEEIIGVSAETLRKAYKRKKEGLSCTEANPNNYPKQKQRGLLRKIQLINEFGVSVKNVDITKIQQLQNFIILIQMKKSFNQI